MSLNVDKNRFDNSVLKLCPVPHILAPVPHWSFLPTFPLATCSLPPDISPCTLPLASPHFPMPLASPHFPLPLVPCFTTFPLAPCPLPHHISPCSLPLASPHFPLPLAPCLTTFPLAPCLTTFPLAPYFTTSCKLHLTGQEVMEFLLNIVSFARKGRRGRTEYVENGAGQGKQSKIWVKARVKEN